MNNKRIALITPMKNEIDNLHDLLNSINKQTISIYIWIIIDDNSNDGSKTYLLNNKHKISNVKFFYVYTKTNLDKDYKLGEKYSSVVSSGFQELSSILKQKSQTVDYVGILDADCKLEYKYYENLIKKFSLLPKLGIASGKLYYYHNGEKIFHRYPDRWAIGGIRLWKYQCFISSGYHQGYSADALSTATARIQGWEVQSFKDSLVYSRPVGKKINSEYYGKSAYYRHLPLYYVYIRFFYFNLIGKKEQVTGYLKGYNVARKQNIKRLSDRKLKKYFRLILLRVLIENILVFKNKLILALSSGK